MRGAVTAFLVLAGIAVAARAPRGVPSDVPYILCETCGVMAGELANGVDGAKGEIDVLDVVEGLCAGRWARNVDLVERWGRLRVVQMGVGGVCGMECESVRLACERVLERGVVEVAEGLWKAVKEGGAERTRVEAWLCRDVCRGAWWRALAAWGRERGPEFVPLGGREREMDELMAGFKGLGGAGGTDLRELEQGMRAMGRARGEDYGEGGGEDDDEDYDDDDDDGDFDDEKYDGDSASVEVGKDRDGAAARVLDNVEDAADGGEL